MKFEELLYQPVRAPLEGFDKAVATGFEIAQNQERLRQAQERLDLEKQQIQQEYLTKGIGTLSTLSKVKSQKQRKILSDMLMQYMSKGGLPFKQETVDALLSDEDTSIAFSDALVQGQKQYPGDPVLAWSKAAELANMDPDTAIDQAQKLKQAQLAAGEKRSLEEFKTEVDVRKEATKRYVDISKKPTPPQVISRSKELYPGDLGKQAEYRELYFSAVGDRINSIRAGVRAGLPEAKKNPQKYKDLMQALVEAENQYIPNTDKSIDAVNKAEEIFGELKGAYKPKETTAKTAAPVNIPKELSTIRKEANAVLKDDIAAARAVDDILGIVDKPGAITAGMILGKMQILREGKVSVLREGEYDRALKEQGIMDRINVFFDKYGSKKGESLGPTARAEYKRLAMDFKKAVLSAIGERSQPYLESARAFGASDDQIKKQIFSPQLHPYIFPKTKDIQKQAFFPTPTGEAPEEQAQQPKTAGKKRWSLKAYKQKNPNLTEDQYNMAKEIAAQSGREVIE